MAILLRRLWSTSKGLSYLALLRFSVRLFRSRWLMAPNGLRGKNFSSWASRIPQKASIPLRLEKRPSSKRPADRITHF
uniref:Secreted protein n=1 Tax=Steinernema glaseri TaxID=37863 RepID=A0A1I7Z3I6_9BILA